MKTNLAIFLVAVSLGVSSLRADDAATKAAGQSNSEFVQQRLGQIELNVALKQFEKVANELADAKTELSVARELASTDQEKKDCQKMEVKVSVLSKVCEELHERAWAMGSDMDARAKASALAANQTAK